MFEPALPYARDGGFAPDARFQAGAIPPPVETADCPLTDAFEEGRQQGLAEAATAAQESAVERRRLGSAIRRLDEDMTAQLARQLSATVAALCEATLAPLALDTDLLMHRCHRAAALIGEHREGWVLHLNPADIALLEAEFITAWAPRPDPALARGALRLEGADGGICDGPEQWRGLLAEALAAC